MNPFKVGDVIITMNSKNVRGLIARGANPKGIILVKVHFGPVVKRLSGEITLLLPEVPAAEVLGD